MPFTIDTDNLENDEFSLTENGSGDLVMEHKSTGATLVYNSTEDQWEPSGGIKTPTLEAESVSTGELSNYHILDPNASDWGQAINDAVSSVSEGGTIVVPAVTFDTSTVGVVDKEGVSVVSLRATGRKSWWLAGPRIKKTGDIGGPFLRLDTRAAVRGISFDAQNATETYDAVEAHSTCYIEGIVGKEIGRHVVHLWNETDTSLNLSQVTNVSGEWGSGSVVRVTNDDNDRNQNGMYIHVRDSFQNTDYAVDIDNGIGNKIIVGAVQGSDHTGAVRLGDNNNHAHVSYIEGDVPQGIVFDGNLNYGEIMHSGLNDRDEEFVLNSDNNRWHRPGSGRRYSGYANMAFDGEDVEHKNPGKGFVVQTPDGSASYRIRVDDSGDVVTDEI